LGTPEERKEKMYDTALLSRHALAAMWVASTIVSPAHNLPRIDSVPVESIQDNLTQFDKFKLSFLFCLSSIFYVNLYDAPRESNRF
jgi:hypothetical protein